MHVMHVSVFRSLAVETMATISKSKYSPFHSILPFEHLGHSSLYVNQVTFIIGTRVSLELVVKYITDFTPRVEEIIYALKIYAKLL